MDIIESRSDIVTYIDNNRPDIVEAGETGRVVAGLLDADHPAWGTDWSGWLPTAIDCAIDFAPALDLNT